MAYLYINSKGKPWRKHSYSAGNDYDQSPLKYYLKKIAGWKERENKARFLFGRALEESIQWHHDHDGQGAVEDFINRWGLHADRKDLQYTMVEKDWDNLNHVGQEMVMLYQIKQPELPIPLGGQTVFQREYSKEVFPGDPNYGEIEDAGKLDIVAYVDPNHPLLEKVEISSDYRGFRPLIVDIKTSGIDFPEQPGIAGFDTQLRRYSWLTGIRDVALLGFKKTGRTLRKGAIVTMLGDAYKGGYENMNTPFVKAGQEAVVAKTEGDTSWIVPHECFLDVYKEHGIPVPNDILTRQRLQFLSGRVSEQSANEAGEIAARQIVQIVNSWKNNSWPNTFGIRYPHDDRNDPYFRAFVLGDTIFKDQNFSKSEEETFEDLFEEGE